MIHHKSCGMELTDVNEAHRCIVFILDYILIFLEMVLLYSICDIEISFPGLFPYLVFIVYWFISVLWFYMFISKGVNTRPSLF